MTQERNCENCAHYHMEAYEYPCNVCEASYDNPPTKWESEDKPQTNAEHIRGMADEELATAMSSWCKATEDCPHCPWYDICPESESVTDWLEWLQQPYKENEDE